MMTQPQDFPLPNADERLQCPIGTNLAMTFDMLAKDFMERR